MRASIAAAAAALLLLSACSGSSSEEPSSSPSTSGSASVSAPAPSAGAASASEAAETSAGGDAAATWETLTVYNFYEVLQEVRDKQVAAEVKASSSGKEESSNMTFAGSVDLPSVHKRFTGEIKAAGVKMTLIHMGKGKTWVKVPALSPKWASAKDKKNPAATLAEAIGPGLSALLEGASLLSPVQTLTKVGPEKINGVDTIHYKGAAKDKTSSAAINLWVDKDLRIIKQSLYESSEDLTLTITFVKYLDKPLVLKAPA